MSTTGIGESVCSRQRRPHADAGIVFGSAATAPVKKPDSVRATCEAMDSRGQLTTISRTARRRPLSSNRRLYCGCMSCAIRIPMTAIDA